MNQNLTQIISLNINKVKEDIENISLNHKP